MLNAEKFKDELLEILSENRYIEVDKYDGKIRKCAGNNCPKCMFGITALGKGRDSCSIAAMLWLLSEYKEPAKLSKLEYELLKFFKNEGYKYIARDKVGKTLYRYPEKPTKNIYDEWGKGGICTDLRMFNDLFQFVQWGDSEPTSINNVLNNCEVFNDAEE